MEPVLSVDRLHKRYDDLVAVEDISFSVSEGEIFGILGPNGAGKTTTIECIQGLREATSGEIQMLGVDAVRQRGELHGRIGSQLQESALPDRIKVWEVLDLFAGAQPGGPDWNHLMDQWGLAGKRNASFADLSGGQRQRLFVALALVNDPDIVFLDELTQGLDPAARRAAWDVIRDIRDHGTTVVLVTHYMDEAEALCDRLAVVNDGRIVASGSPRELVTRESENVRIRFSTEAPDVSWLDNLDVVESVHQHRNQVEVRGRGPVLALVAAELVSHGIVPVDLHPVETSLEDVYFELIGRTREESDDAHARETHLD